MLAPPRPSAAQPPQPPHLPLILLHQISKIHRGDIPEDRVLRGVVRGGGDVENALESAGEATNLDGGARRRRGRRLSGGGQRRGSPEARAEEETDAPDEEILDVADGVDLNCDGGGFAVHEFFGDSEEELVVPGRVFSAEGVDSGSELRFRVDPGDGVCLHPAHGSGGRLQTLGGDQVDLQNQRLHNVKPHKSFSQFAASFSSVAA